MRSPTYILGPCSAESREQVLLTASQIKAACGEMPFIFRAGAWKPRTSPHTFQGVGEEALAWLAEAKQQYGIAIATEVATPEQAQKAIAAGIDYLWIGARTSASPMAVEAIAKVVTVDGLKGIFIKNPVNEDAALWIGNIERLEKSGVPVIAVHRGCGHKPCWSMAHQVRLSRPDIPMLLDPSHMSGEAAKVPVLMEKVEELGMNGAMIEVHCCPEQALSDKYQQITPTQLVNTLDSLVSRLCLASLICPPSDEKELNWLRAEIDELDEKLWDTIASRMDVSKRIGEWKKVHGVAPLQPERYEQIVESLRQKVERLGLDETFMLRMWELIHEESLKQQK